MGATMTRSQRKTQASEAKEDDGDSMLTADAGSTDHQVSAPRGLAADVADVAASRRHLLQVQPPRFNGTGQDADAWLADLRRVAPAHGWRPEDDVAVIPALLTGAAASWYDQLPEEVRHDAERLRQALRAAFGRANADVAAGDELLLRRQRPGETVVELAVAINHLCSKVDPSMSTAQRVHRLIQALRPELRMAVAANLPDGASWEDVVTVAKRVEAYAPPAPIAPAPATIHAITPSAAGPASSTPQWHDELRQILHRLDQRLEALETRDGHGHNDRVCERCGKFGHRAAVCRAPAPRFRHPPQRSNSASHQQAPPHQPHPHPDAAASPRAGPSGANRQQYLNC